MLYKFSFLCCMSILLMGVGVLSADQASGKAVVELCSSDAIPVADGEMLTFPVAVSTEIFLAGAQFRLSFDASKVVPQDPVLTERSENMTLVYAVHGNEMIILVYSTGGEQIAPGSGPLLNVPCTFKGGDQSPGLLSVEEVILADVEAQAIPAIVRTTMSERIQAPTYYGLAQNYPNPFNPETDIQYQIADGGSPVHTTLKIYNILGQEVRSLVNGMRSPGYHAVTWDGSDNSGYQVASGVYFYRLVAGDYIDTRSMLLLK